MEILNAPLHLFLLKTDLSLGNVGVMLCPYCWGSGDADVKASFP